MKKVLLAELYAEYTKQFNDQEIVLGSGNPDSPLLLIGEAPGKDEVRLSQPFVGAAGRNLNEFLEISGIDRDSVYITNAIKYRLSKANPKTGRLSNRPATRDDIERNREYLLREIHAISPRFIVTLGNVPLRAVTGDHRISIGSKHGCLEELPLAENTYRLFALYHPASIIYNRSLKGIYIEDIHKLKNLYKNP